MGGKTPGIAAPLVGTPTPALPGRDGVSQAGRGNSLGALLMPNSTGGRFGWGGTAEAHPPTCILPRKGEEVGRDVPHGLAIFLLAPMPLRGRVRWGEMAVPST